MSAAVVARRTEIEPSTRGSKPLCTASSAPISAGPVTSKIVVAPRRERGQGLAGAAGCKRLRAQREGHPDGLGAIAAFQAHPAADASEGVDNQAKFLHGGIWGETCQVFEANLPWEAV